MEEEKRKKGRKEERKEGRKERKILICYERLYFSNKFLYKNSGYVSLENNSVGFS